MRPSTEEQTLFYEEFGKGKPLFLLHGFLENRTMWEPFIAHLSTRNHVFVVDLPGHGQSPVLEGSNTMDRMAQQVFKIVQEHHLNEVSLVGHSMGGYVALAFAKLYTQYVNGICLLNSTPKADTQERVALRKHGIQVAEKNYEALVSMSVANLFSKELRKDLAEVIAHTKQEALKTPLEGYVEAQKGMMLRFDATAIWREASFQKWMLLGAQDTLIDAQGLRAELESESIKIEVLKGGHMLHIENFEGVLSTLQVFCE